MRLEPSERETIILFSDADDTASVYTFDKKLKARLKELHRRQPDKIYPASKGRSGSVCFVVPKNCISIQGLSLGRRLARRLLQSREPLAKAS